MRYYLSALVIAVSFLLTGCFDITEEITLKRDGSGHYQVAMDLSDMLSNPFMEQALAEELEKDNSDMEEMELDSTITFAQIEDKPEGLTAADEALLEKLTIHMDISKSKEKMMITMDYPFDNFAQYERLNELMSELSAQEEAAKAAGEEFNNPFSMFGGLDDFNSSKSTFSLKGKVLERKVIQNEPGEKEEGLDEETLAMVKMMMADVSFKTVYHLPGKVKKTTFQNAEVQGKTVTVEYDLIEMVEKKVDMAGTIKFK